MSRVGKKPILIPENVEVKIEGQKVIVKGPKGELSQEIRPEIKVEVKEGRILITPQVETSKHPPLNFGGGPAGQTKKIKAFWGLTRSLIANMIQGVSVGFEKKLEIQGIGFKAVIEGEDLVLYVGFSHLVRVKIPKDIKIIVEKNIITVSGVNKERVGQITALIRKVKPPEPYKGKGIRYLGEVVRKKVGKKAVSTG